MDDGTADERVIGVGPHARPWPEDDRYDPELLEHGDRRNVADRFRYWRREAIVAELDRSRHAFHVAIENVEDDRNIGSIVRTANALAIAGTVALAAAIGMVVYLIADVVYGSVLARISATAISLLAAGLWFVLPLVSYRKGADDRSAR